MPINLLKSAEEELNFTKRLVVTEEFKDMPFGAVWEEFSNRENVPNGQTLIKELERYQTSVSGRSRE